MHVATEIAVPTLYRMVICVSVASKHLHQQIARLFLRVNFVQSLFGSFKRTRTYKITVPNMKPFHAVREGRLGQILSQKGVTAQCLKHMR